MARIGPIDSARCGSGSLSLFRDDLVNGDEVRADAIELPVFPPTPEGWTKPVQLGIPANERW